MPFVMHRRWQMCVIAAGDLKAGAEAGAGWCQQVAQPGHHSQGHQAREFAHHSQWRGMGQAAA